jgi:hypothetical protein
MSQVEIRINELQVQGSTISSVNETRRWGNFPHLEMEMIFYLHPRKNAVPENFIKLTFINVY